VCRIETSQYASDIAVDGRIIFIEGDAQERAGGVIPDPRQRAKLVVFSRKLTPMFAHDLARGDF
jgi:hypothetical protein